MQLDYFKEPGEINQDRFIYSEIELTPFMTLIYQKNGTWCSYPLQKEQIISKGSKIVMNKKSNLTYQGTFKLHIASIGV